MQINKSDRNDAAGIARIMQCGWYREVRVKDLDSHAIRALLSSRALLVELKREAGSREPDPRIVEELWARHRARQDDDIHNAGKRVA